MHKVIGMNLGMTICSFDDHNFCKAFSMSIPPSFGFNYQVLKYSTSNLVPWLLLVQVRAV